MIRLNGRDTVRQSVSFTTTEWAVIAIGQRDHPRTLKPANRPSWLGWLFGRSPSPTLADPRLEALRRMTILVRHYDYAVPALEVEAFTAAGFSACHLKLLLAGSGAPRLIPQESIASPSPHIAQPAFA